MPGTTDTNVLLVTALEIELRPTIERLRLEPRDNVFHGHVGTRRVTAVVSGVGGRMARRVASMMASGESAKPHRMIVAGFAGGLDAALTPGHIVDARWVKNVEGEVYELSEQPPRLCEAGDAGSTKPTSQPTAARTVLTVDQVVTSRQAKRELFEAHRAAVVDMESFAVAALAAKHGVGLSVVRAVSDPASFSLPRDIARWTHRDGRANTGAACRALLTRPWLLPAILRLARYSKFAAKRLADEVEAEIEKMGADKSIPTL